MSPSLDAKPNTSAKSLLPHKITHSQVPGLGYKHLGGEGVNHSANCTDHGIYAKPRERIPDTMLTEAKYPIEITWYMKMYTWSRKSGLNVKKVL